LDGLPSTRILLASYPKIQETIKSSLQKPAEQGAVSVVTDLWSDNIVSRSYLDVTLFWVEESGPDNRIWSLKCAMYNIRMQIFS